MQGDDRRRKDTVPGHDAAARAVADATLVAAQAAEGAALAIDAEQAELDPDLMYAHAHAMRMAETTRQYTNLKIADLALLTGVKESSCTDGQSLGGA